MKFIYFIYSPCTPSLFVFIFGFLPPLLLWVVVFLREKAAGYVIRGLKDGPSRHPEKVYRGGDGHERGGRGEGRGQLRERLYGGSQLKSTPSCLCIMSISYFIVFTFPSVAILHSPPPSRLLFPCIPLEVRRQGAATLPSSFSSHFQALHGGLGFVAEITESQLLPTYLQ